MAGPDDRRRKSAGRKVNFKATVETHAPYDAAPAPATARAAGLPGAWCACQCVERPQRWGVRRCRAQAQVAPAATREACAPAAPREACSQDDITPQEMALGRTSCADTTAKEDIAMEKPEPCLPLATSGRKKWKGLMAAPHPMVYLGPQHFGQWAQRLTRTLQQGGSPAFGEELAKSIELVIDLQFGFGVGATAMRRLGPLVQRILSGYIHEPYEPGKGQRYVPSYLRGLMPEQPFHDPKDHPWHKELVKHHAMMLEEAKERGQPWHWKGGDNETMVREYAQQWRGLSWVKYGMWAEGYEDFPKACNVIESLVGVRMYECLIAKLPPGAGVAPHSDNNNYILTVHIGLELEEDGCTITVGDQTREWGVGEALAFDHTYIHSVYNDSDRDRYVMIIRFWHPDCTDEERYGLIFLNLIVREIKLMGGGEELFTRPDCESSQKYTSPSQPALVGGNFGIPAGHQLTNIISSSYNCSPAPRMLQG